MISSKLYLIDATAFCYRAYYAMPSLITSSGQPTGAVYGFVKMLNKIMQKEKPEYLGVCFDVSRETFRTKKFAEYKIQRPPMPDPLVSQIPIIKKIVRAYGLALVEKEGYEADDIIATLSSHARAKKMPVEIISSDKDILQLVDEKVSVYSPYKDEGTLYDEKAVKERFGVSPKQIADIITLMGDSVDNIPGIPGIGEKTALDLISEFGSLENLLKNLEKVKKEKIKVSLKEHLKQIKLNRELVELCSDVKLDLSFDDLEVRDPDNIKLMQLFKELEFRKMLVEVSKGLPQEPAAEVKEIDEAPSVEVLKGLDEMFLYADSNDALYIHAGNKSFKAGKVTPELSRLLASSKVEKTGHDLKRIKLLLSKEGQELEGMHFDTMIAAYLLNPAKPRYALEDLFLDYLDKIIPPEHLSPADALKQIALLENKLSAQLKEKSLDELFRDLEMPLITVLADMELSGITIDLELFKQISRDIEKRLTKLIEEVYELSGTQFNINSTQQLRTVLFERLKLPVIKKGKTGPSTDEEVLRKLADKHKLPAALLEYRQLNKLKTTYIDVLPGLVDKDTGRIHTSFNQTGTETGRLSSSDPNLQNIPIKTDIGKQIRKAIIPSAKTHLLLSCDYSQIELRFLAHFSKDEVLIRAFKHNKDIHRATAALIYGLDEADVQDEMREASKRVNFGIIYGLTSYGLSRDLGIKVEEAQNFIDNYFFKYPGVKEYIEEQIARAKKQGFVTTILGRRRYLPEINSKNQMMRMFAERQAVNTPLQGSASDLIKLAMVDIHKAILAKGLRSRMNLQVHDELVFDVPHDEVKELIVFVRERMEHVLKLEVPIRVDVKKGKNWLEMQPA